MSAARHFVKNFYAIGLITGAVPPALNARVDGDMSANIIGPTTDISLDDQVMLQVKWTSSNAVGVISVQVSTDGTQWDDITFNPALAQPNSDNGQYSILLAAMPNTLIRVKYARTSGTGRMEVRFSAKGS